MTEAQHPGGGWTIGRILGLVVGLIGMVGFGICSLCGIAITGGNLRDLGTVMIFVLPGLGLTFLSFLLVRAMIRRARKRPEDGV